MINTEGPQTNLTLGDKVFLWSWMLVCGGMLIIYLVL
jgi:hypothetical protein